MARIVSNVLAKLGLARAQLARRIKFIRRDFALTQEAFSARHMIPVQTLRASAQGVAEPDAAGRAYTSAMIGDAERVARALRARLETAAE